MRLASHLVLHAAIVAACAFAPLPARAGVPSAANSTLPSCIKASPDGSAIDVFVVRDLAHVPINNSLVVLDYSDCPTFVPCPQGAGSPPDDYVVDLPTHTIRTFTNGSGQAVFYLRAGGGCFVYPIRIYADGVFLGSRRASSTDQNGDLAVNATDVAILTAKVGTTDLTGDLDCDGVVNSYDLSIQNYSLGAECLGPTPARPSTWGRVKLIYR